MFVNETSLTVLCMSNSLLIYFYLLLFSFLACQDSYLMKRIYAYGWLVRMEKKINVHQMLTTVFTKVLRLFDDEIFKIFKTIQPQSKNQTFL